MCVAARSISEYEYTLTRRLSADAVEEVSAANKAKCVLGNSFTCVFRPVPMQTLVAWISAGRATTTVVDMSQYEIGNGNHLTFEVRAIDPVGNVGQSSKATPIVVDETPPVPGTFTKISVTGVNDGNTQTLHSGNGLYISRGIDTGPRMHHRRQIVQCMYVCMYIYVTQNARARRRSGL